MASRALCASRLLALHFGNTTVVWANVIGLVLVYLSVGYWLGGRVADRHPHPRVLGALLLVAAAAISVLPFNMAGEEIAAGGRFFEALLPTHP